MSNPSSKAVLDKILFSESFHISSIGGSFHAASKIESFDIYGYLAFRDKTGKLVLLPKDSIAKISQESVAAEKKKDAEPE